MGRGGNSVVEEAERFGLDTFEGSYDSPPQTELKEANHRVSVNRFTRGRTPIRPQRTLYGFQVRCRDCGYKAQINEANKKEAEKLAKEHALANGEFIPSWSEYDVYCAVPQAPATATSEEVFSKSGRAAHTVNRTLKILKEKGYIGTHHGRYFRLKKIITL
jgi:hypothetical protein